MSDPSCPHAPPRRGVDAVPPGVDTTPEGESTLRIVAWSDPVIDTLGHDPRSWYVEHFWLPIIGPTSTWLVRRLVAGLDAEPDGFDMGLETTARALGLGGRAGRHSPFHRAVARCVTFGLGRQQGPGTLGVRRRVPPLPRRHLQRLPPALQEAHARWTDGQRRPEAPDEWRRRSRRLALRLLENGEAEEAVEVQLMRWRVHPAMAHEATEWATSLRSGSGAPSGAPTGTAPATTSGWRADQPDS
jgi:hypothetical protein